ncbi:Peptidase M14, carboxypeptidase A [Phytophthora cactorum]|nr:Peptidase M14, carboxypeptidase A [Phytophthora cactorum]
MDASDERENDYLRFLRGMRPDDANIQASMPDLSTTQSSELDFRTSFVGPDGLPEIDHDGAEFARMLLAQAEQEHKDTDTEAEEAVVAAQAEAEEAAAAVTGVLQLSSARVRAEASQSRRAEKAPAPKATDNFVLTKKTCRFYNKERERCKRAATGLDGRCAIHKVSQFCKHPKCNKYNQGNGFCIKHGGGKKCKHEGCEKHVQGYGYCSGHGGKPLCPIEGCENKRMEGGYCKAHGGGRFCQHEDCKKRDIGGGLCISHGGGKKCNAKECKKVDRGGGFCKAHGGGKKCETENCKNWALGGGICLEHKGPGKRCKMLGCTKYDLGGGFCIAHGGGRKCIIEGCTKIRQVNKRCRGHGGKVLCSVPNCDRAAQNRKLCKSHGGGKLCKHEGCTNTQKGKGFCIRHGGGTRCKEEGCSAIQRGGGFCKGHGGGKKCSYTYCKKWVVGGGYCDDHLDLELSRQPEEISRIAANSYLTIHSGSAGQVNSDAPTAAMLLPCLLLALLAAPTSANPPSPPINYKTYAEMTRYLLELNATFPDVVQVSVAQDTYDLPYPEELQCIIDDETKATEPCKQFLVHMTNHSTLASDPERPEVFISGALHGNERAKPTLDTQRWLKQLVNTRNVLVTPMTNAYGYSHNHREELTVDPNRDYNYMRSGAECMQTMTSRVVNEIWRDHIFQLAVTFHGGTRAIGNTLANFAGVFPDGKLYPTGTMNDVVYGVSGGMEDWGYAASWENQFYDAKSQPFHACEPSTFVETSNTKEPKAADLGNFKELYEANVDFFRTEGITTEFVGHVPRNVRLALMMIEMAQPLVQIAWEVLGALTVDSTHVQVSSSETFEDDAILMKTSIQKGTTRRFYEFASDSSQAAAANVDTLGTSLFVTCLDLGNVTSDKLYVRAVATVDQDWKKQGTGDEGPSPHVPPQSHLVNARTNPDWDFEWNGHRVKAALEWTSPVITVETAKKSEANDVSSAIIPNSPVTDVPASFSPSGSTENESEDSDDSTDAPIIGKKHTKKASDDDESEESEDSSDEAAATTTAPSSATESERASTKTTDKDDGESDDESEDSEDDKDSDDNTLDDEMKASDDEQAKSSSSDTTQDATALATNGSGLDDKPASGLLQFGYIIMSSCAMIIVLTLAYLYRRVFRRPRQPYMNISSLEQPTRVTINSIADEDYDVDDDESEDVSAGPRIPRHAQSSRGVILSFSFLAPMEVFKRSRNVEDIAPPQCLSTMLLNGTIGEDGVLALESDRRLGDKYRGLRSCDEQFNALVNGDKSASQEGSKDTDTVPKPPQMVYTEYLNCTGTALCEKPLLELKSCINSVLAGHRNIGDCAQTKRLLERCMRSKSEELLQASQPQVFRPHATP